MNKRNFIAILLACTTVIGWARPTTQVWDTPTVEHYNIIGDGYFIPALDITQVELSQTETVVHMTLSLRSDYPEYKFKFESDYCLQIGEQRYALTSADGIMLDSAFQTGRDGRLDFALHFKPLPQGTRSFDLTGGDVKKSFHLRGIKPAEERWNQILPSYWRNDETGDWEIAFTEECAIYQCKFWDYKERNIDPKTGVAEMVLTDGKEDLHVSVGKDKRGKRTITIGDDRRTYGMINSRFMPDYPVADTRTSFVDNGYRPDTVTVIGWIKDMPAELKKDKNFAFSFKALITDRHEKVNAQVDELGRFTIKIPIINSTEFFFDWKRCFLRVMLEPGQTYFMLYDYQEGRRYFMGKDVRLQNELFRYPLDWKVVKMERNGDYATYTTSVDSLLRAQYAYIDRLCAEHPSLSSRYKLYRRGNTTWQQADLYGMAKYYVPGRKMPPMAQQYAYDTFWKHLESPLTMHREAGSFVGHFISDIRENNRRPIGFSWLNHIDELALEHDDLIILLKWKAERDLLKAEMDKLNTDEDKRRLKEEFDAKNAELHAAVDNIIKKPEFTQQIHLKLAISGMLDTKFVLDSLQTPSSIRNLWLCKMACNTLDNTRGALPDDVMDSLRTWTDNAPAIQVVEEENAISRALDNREFDRLVLKSADSLQGITEGEALLNKILEPYRGKFVLLDVWGTWCAPCKEALKSSSEEYKQLAGYNIQFLYLANRSPQKSWENVIKQYNVTGDNVAHYNLPQEQQSAIEGYLKISSFPTYKLFDREGRLIDVKVDARNLKALKTLLDKLK